MSNTFKKWINDISEKLQQSYEEKEKVKNKNQELRIELQKFLDEYKK